VTKYHSYIVSKITGFNFLQMNEEGREIEEYKNLFGVSTLSGFCSRRNDKRISAG